MAMHSHKPAIEHTVQLLKHCYDSYTNFMSVTQSYTGYEPTSMRAIRARYHPYVQARSRVDQLRRLGHSVDKASLSPTSCVLSISSLKCHSLANRG